MSGTVNGGKRAAATNKAKHGADFYRRIGAKGGKANRLGAPVKRTTATSKLKAAA